MLVCWLTWNGSCTKLNTCGKKVTHGSLTFMGPKLQPFRLDSPPGAADLFRLELPDPRMEEMSASDGDVICRSGGPGL